MFVRSVGLGRLAVCPEIEWTNRPHRLFFATAKTSSYLFCALGICCLDEAIGPEMLKLILATPRRSTVGCDEWQ